MEHLRENGLSQGYYCMRCGQVVNMLATGHGPDKCESNSELVKTLNELNSKEK